jgi:two-component system, OmpR family, phosphate regulon sensor histidine kinase PhoR
VRDGHRPGLFVAFAALFLTGVLATGLWLNGALRTAGQPPMDFDLLSPATLLFLLVGLVASGLAAWVLGGGPTSVDTPSPVVTDGSQDEVARPSGSMELLSEELERNRATLAGERARFEAVLDSMSEAVLAVDADEVVQVVNRPALRMLGLDAPPLDQSLAEVLAVPELAGIAARTRQAGMLSLEFDHPGPPGRRLVLRAGAEKDADGVVIVLLDVTETRHLERVRRDFVANVSHELRTPVAVILANSETLLHGALDDKAAAARFVQAIERHAERLSHLIDDLLDIARIEAGRYDLELGAVDVEVLGQRLIDGLQEHARKRGLIIETDVTPGLHVQADERALDQVLLNLLENGVRYNTTGTRVVLRAREAAGQVRIEVEDDGPGLPAHEQSRLFERFYRVDPGRSRAQGGTGLGLSIVKHLVEGMGGRVSVESKPGEGATFVVELTG